MKIIDFIYFLLPLNTAKEFILFYEATQYAATLTDSFTYINVKALPSIVLP